MEEQILTIRIYRLTYGKTYFGYEAMDKNGRFYSQAGFEGVLPALDAAYARVKGEITREAVERIPAEEAERLLRKYKFYDPAGEWKTNYLEPDDEKA